MRRWIFPVIGLLAIALLVWFGGPLLGIGASKPLTSAFSRILLIIVAVLVWGLAHLYKELKAKQAGTQLAKDLAEPGPAAAKSAPAPGEEDVAQLQKNFQAALKVLRTTKMKGQHGEQPFHNLPWYIIIGPPGAGKTTALANSGLRFPLANQFGNQGLRGVGGTRDCDWWFTDDAVLIDTAGRYTTQDSDAAVDTAGWEGFLGLLKKYRKRRPINGVLIAISLADLMQQTEGERQNHAATIKKRILELKQKLGVDFPIYVLFTKLDLVAGFTEFFDDLSREERTQVLGITFPTELPGNAQDMVSTFGQEYDRLIARLDARLMLRLQQERDLSRRSMVHGFPYQMAALKGLADDFLQQVFRPNRYEEPLMLRGVYFTSGTQEGTRIDRLMGSLAATFGLSRQAAPLSSGQGRSYFLTRLFKDVIFQEADIAGTDQRVEQRRAWLERGVYAGAVGIAILAVIVWTSAYTRNANRLHALEGYVASYRDAVKQINVNSDLIQSLPALNALRSATLVYQNDSLGWLTELGLDQRGNLIPPATAAYHRALQNILLPRIGAQLEQQLRDTTHDSASLFTALKLYLMLGDPKRLDPKLLEYWMDADWQTTLVSQPENLKLLRAHLHALLSTPPPPLALNNALVASARAAVRREPLAQRVYDRIKQSTMTNQELALSLDDLLGGSGERLLHRRNPQGTSYIPALFTYQGYHKLFLKDISQAAKESTEDNWVVNDGTQTQPRKIDMEQLNNQVTRLYLADYQRIWEDLLGNLSITPFNDFNNALDRLDDLAGPKSPLQTLLQAVANNTDLTRPPNSALGAVGKATQKLASKLSAAAPGNDAGNPLQIVRERFSPLADMVTASKGAPAQLAGILNQLADLRSYLAPLAAAEGGAALRAAQQHIKGGQDAIGVVRSTALRLPEPIQTWLHDLSRESWRMLLIQTRTQINTAWKSEVIPEYEHTIKDRYPISRSGSHDMTLSEFTGFFGPQGTMDKFFTSYLQPFINTSTRRWQPRPFDQVALGIDPESLAMLQNAFRIKEAYFPPGAKQPSVAFTLKPEDLDTDVTRFTLDLDGQRLTYRHGPTRPIKLTWPGTDGASRVRINFETVAGRESSRVFEGPWDWLRCLEQARVVNTRSGRRQTIEFRIDRHKARFEMQNPNRFNPFRFAGPIAFRLPQAL